MKQVITAREADQILRNGGAASIPADAVLTPSARDIFRDAGLNGGEAQDPLGDGRVADVGRVAHGT